MIPTHDSGDTQQSQTQSAADVLAAELNRMEHEATTAYNDAVKAFEKSRQLSQAVNCKRQAAAMGLVSVRTYSAVSGGVTVTLSGCIKSWSAVATWDGNSKVAHATTANNALFDLQADYNLGLFAYPRDVERLIGIVSRMSERVEHEFKRGES